VLNIPLFHDIELPLELRCQQLCLRYISKLRPNPCNPAFSNVLGTGFRLLSEDRSNTIPTLGIRMNQNILDSEINLNSIATNSTPDILPLLLKPPGPYTYLETGRRFLLLFSNHNSMNLCLNMMVILACSLRFERLQPSWHVDCVRNAYQTANQSQLRWNSET